MTIPSIRRLVTERDRCRADADELEGVRQELQKWRGWVPPGHFYSPIPGPEDIRRRVCEDDLLLDIDLDMEGQRAMLEAISQYYGEFPYSNPSLPGARFSFNQEAFLYSDAVYFYGMLRHFKPARLVEVGSGHSSALALDTNERFLNGTTKCDFVEPYPDVLERILRAEDRGRIGIHRTVVQDVPMALFTELCANDILFIDSSHVCKVGSDVYHLVFRVLPRLQSGVLIHFHDIFFPFEYPLSWLQAGRAWNEAYVVRALLQNNPRYQIVLFGSFVGCRMNSVLQTIMPLCLRDTGGSLWLRKK